MSKDNTAPVGTEKKSERLDWLDVLKCLAMLIVVLGHCTKETTNTSPRYYAYAFHMPLFFMISGIGMYMQLSRRSYRFMEMLKGKVRGLLWPYLCLNLLLIPHWILNFRILHVKKESFKELFLAIFYSNQKWNSLPSSTTWFITTLFLAVMVFYLIVRWCRGNEQQILLYGGFMGLVTYTVALNTQVELYYPWHLDTVPMAVMFLAIGYVFMANYGKVDAFFRGNRIRQILGFLLSLTVGFLCARFNCKISMGVNSYGSLILFVGGVFGFSMACYLASLWIPAWGAVKLIGRNTIIYLAIHEQIIRTFQYADTTTKFMEAHPYVVGCFVFIVLIPVAYVVERFFPWIIGRRPKKV